MFVVFVVEHWSTNIYKCIGANRPGTPGTVPDLEALSLVPPGKCYLPEMSRIFKVAAPELG